MLCVRFLRRAVTQDLRLASISLQSSQRMLSSLHAPIRPSRNSISQAPYISPMTSSGSLSMPTSLDATPLDLMPKISSHPALMGTQIRSGPRNTWSPSPSHYKRKRRVGFLARLSTPAGRKILKARRLKGRRSLSH